MRKMFIFPFFQALLVDNAQPALPTPRDLGPLARKVKRLQASIEGDIFSEAEAIKFLSGNGRDKNIIPLLQASGNTE